MYGSYVLINFGNLIIQMWRVKEGRVVYDSKKF